MGDGRGSGMVELPLKRERLNRFLRRKNRAPVAVCGKVTPESHELASTRSSYNGSRQIPERSRRYIASARQRSRAATQNRKSSLGCRRTTLVGGSASSSCRRICFRSVLWAGSKSSRRREPKIDPSWMSSAVWSARKHDVLRMSRAGKSSRVQRGV